MLKPAMKQMPEGKKERPEVSLVIIALNEEKSLPKLLQDIQSQTFEHDKIEIILVDGMSEDRTRSIMEDFAQTYDFYDIICQNNPKIIQASGWNTGIQHSTGKVIIRLDAHARLPEDFIEKCIAYIKQGHDICGGKVKNYVPEKTKWSLVVNMAEDSMFGGSIAAFRHKDEAGYVDTLAFAACKREIFEKIGSFNEKLLRTEDNEMHYRMRKAGYKFYYTPDIMSYRETRPTFKKLLRQKYLNGYWVGLTVKICPKCFSIYHFVPLMFVLGIVGTTICSCMGLWQLAAVMWGLYGLFDVVMSVASCFAGAEKSIYCLMLPILFLVLHVGYGLGTLKGILLSPWILK
jgi:glycosyltransferase involved in cell wall biosynthesis